MLAHEYSVPPPALVPPPASPSRTPRAYAWLRITRVRTAEEARARTTVICHRQHVRCFGQRQINRCLGASVSFIIQQHRNTNRRDYCPRAHPGGKRETEKTRELQPGERASSYIISISIWDWNKSMRALTLLRHKSHITELISENNTTCCSVQECVCGIRGVQECLWDMWDTHDKKCIWRRNKIPTSN